MIRAQRLRTADFLEQLTPQQWQVQSLCDAWTVHDVAAHLVMPLVTPMPKFALAMMRTLGNFDRASERMTAEVAGSSSLVLVDQLRQHAGSHFTPPGLGPGAPLTDVIVHGQDVAIPLDMNLAIDQSALIASLQFVTSPESRRGFIPRNRIDGLRFHATDVDWSTGEGRLVEGCGRDLLLAIAGRPVVFSQLAGDGAAELAQRIES